MQPSVTLLVYQTIFMFVTSCVPILCHVCKRNVVNSYVKPASYVHVSCCINVCHTMCMCHVVSMYAILFLQVSCHVFTSHVIYAESRLGKHIIPSVLLTSHACKYHAIYSCVRHTRIMAIIICVLGSDV